jgi:hypothetical protein
MKNSILFSVLMLVSVIFFSCQKSDLGHETSNQEVLEIQMASANANGGGPYVLNMVIQLRGENEVPAVNTSALGVAHLRLTADRKLYSKIIISNLEEGDALRFAHIHMGAEGVNGPVRVFLAHTPDDFGKNMVQTVSLEHYNLILNGAAYVNAHSNFYPPGIVRGQIR